MSTVKAIGIIPARYGSTRFPGKPLSDIAGKTMIRRVYEQCQLASLSKVVVATDDDRIAGEVKSFGGEVVITGSHHPSGTDRCQEAYSSIRENYEVVVNIQGDEPFIHPDQINAVIDCFEVQTVQIATLGKRAHDFKEIQDANRVKVIRNLRGDAIYFSRGPIPFQKDNPHEEWTANYPYFIHLGMYAYRPHILDEITQLKPSALEKAESLEQLRWIEHGYRIRVAETEIEAYPVDHPEDLENIIARLKAGDFMD